MKYDIQGEVVAVGDTVTFGSFSKQEIVIQVGKPEWPNPVKLDVLEKQFDILDGVNEGDWVKGQFYLVGREDKKTPGKFWLNLRLMSLDRAGNTERRDDPEPKKPAGPVEKMPAGTAEDDNLPF